MPHSASAVQVSARSSPSSRARSPPLIVASFTIAVTRSAGRADRRARARPHGKRQPLDRHDDRPLQQGRERRSRALHDALHELPADGFRARRNAEASISAASPRRRSRPAARRSTSISRSPMQFLEKSGAIATVFARTGDDFVRVTTSLKKQDGTRAIGTLLDRKGPAYAPVLAGKRVHRHRDAVRQAVHHRVQTGHRSRRAA